MSLESLGDYFQRSNNQSNFNLIYLAYTLERVISSEFDQSVKVVIRKSRIVVFAPDQAAAASLNLQQSKIRQLLRDIGPRQLAAMKVIIRVKYS